MVWGRSQLRLGTSCRVWGGGDGCPEEGPRCSRGACPGCTQLGEQEGGCLVLGALASAAQNRRFWLKRWKKQQGGARPSSCAL